MNTLLFSHPEASVRSRRQRDWEEDQSRWEARLRKLAGRMPAEEKIVAAPRLLLARTALELAAKVSHRDNLLIPRSLPTFTGTEPEDLVCGKCSDIIGRGITSLTARREHPQGSRLVVRCPCGALNLLSRKRRRSLQ
jgi:RNase P subunit RPR2